MTFKQQLIDMYACREVIDWVEDRTMQQTWCDCHRGEWMLWLLEKMKGKAGWPDEKEIMLLGCWCARRTLKYVPKVEDRPLKAIEAKEGWVRGEITKEEMRVAINAASAAAWDAAWAAAWAAANADTLAAAWAAASAAALVHASYIAKYAVWAAASDEESLIQANHIRKNVAFPEGGLCLLNNG